jgi:hypothetical protein
MIWRESKKSGPICDFLHFRVKNLLQVPSTIRKHPFTGGAEVLVGAVNGTETDGWLGKIRGFTGRARRLIRAHLFGFCL